MKNFNLNTTIETEVSKSVLDGRIKDYVASLDLAPAIEVATNTIEKINSLGSTKIVDTHKQLISTLDINKALTVALAAVIKEELTTSSYVERNLVANRIGKKLFKAKHFDVTNTTEFQLATLKLSLGLNVLHILSTTNLISFSNKLNKENHNITRISINKGLDLTSLKTIVNRARAGRPMLTTPRYHSVNGEGGYQLDSMTMLNKSGFNTIKTQNDVTNIAINKLQEVAYNVRSDFNVSKLEEWLDSDKFRDADGLIMRGETSKLLSDIELVKGTEFHIPLAYDSRGRIYSRTSYVTTQGDSIQKAMLQFNKKELLTDEGMYYLKVAIANELYNDKIDMDDAIDWFDDQSTQELEELAKNNITAEMLLLDYKKTLLGLPVGTITHWDATNSGLQFYAILAKDLVTASLCNVKDTGVIADAYKALADKLNKLLSTDTFNRSNVKKAFMVYLYGSGKKNIMTTIEDSKNGVTSGIIEFFPSDMKIDDAWSVFSKAMKEIVPSAVELMSLFYRFNSEGKSCFEFSMPDGFNVQFRSTETTKVRGWYIDSEGKDHEGSIEVKIENYDAASKSMAPNIIHAIDAYFLRMVIARCDFEISAIHDSFGCHPNNINKLLQVAREVMAEMLDMDLVGHILSQLNDGQYQSLLKRGKVFSANTLTKEDVLSSKNILR